MNKELTQALERAALEISGKSWIIPANPKDAKCLVTFLEAFQIMKKQIEPLVGCEDKSED